MFKLKKSQYNTEIKSIITQYKFLLFFHYNTIQSPEWKLIKTKISHFPTNVRKNICIKVIKNKITYEILKKFYPEKKQKIFLLCQGPNFIIGVNSILECKNICKILNVSKEKSSEKHDFSIETICNTSTLFSSEKAMLPKVKVFCIEKNINIHENTSLLHGNTKHNLVFKKNEINTENTNIFVWIPSFIFIGGLFENKIINNLDLQKLCFLNNSVYNKLVATVNSPAQNYVFLQNTTVMNFLFSFQKTSFLFYVLNKHKQNLIKKNK